MKLKTFILLFLLAGIGQSAELTAGAKSKHCSADAECIVDSWHVCNCLWQETINKGYAYNYPVGAVNTTCSAPCKADPAWVIVSAKCEQGMCVPGDCKNKGKVESCANAGVATPTTRVIKMQPATTNGQILSPGEKPPPTTIENSK